MAWPLGVYLFTQGRVCVRSFDSIIVRKIHFYDVLACFLSEITLSGTLALSVGTLAGVC